MLATKGTAAATPATLPATLVAAKKAPFVAIDVAVSHIPIRQISKGLHLQ
jgi:hypothetical protein